MLYRLHAYVEDEDVGRAEELADAVVDVRHDGMREIHNHLVMVTRTGDIILTTIS